MSVNTRVYDHALMTGSARRLVVVVLAAFALVLGAVPPATAAGETISGTVSDSDGADLPDVGVVVYRFNDVAGDPQFDYFAQTSTDSAGHYVLNVSPGKYRVRFVDNADEYAPEWYENASTLASATDIVVVPGGAPVAHAVLGRYGSLSGQVIHHPTDPASDSVALIDTVSGVVHFASLSDGNYHLSHVAPGTYKLAFNRISGFAYSAAQFWNATPEHDGVGAADLITVGEDEDLEGYDAILEEGGRLTGTLVDPGGNGLSCRVEAYTADASLVLRSAVSDADGSFDISGLTTGDYLVRVLGTGDCTNGRQFVAGGGGALFPTAAEAEPVATTLGTNTALTPALVYNMPTIANTSLPTVSGIPKAGRTLTASPGVWSELGTTYSYRWHSGATTWKNSTSPALVVPAGAVAKSITVTVTAARPQYTSGTATSPATSAVAKGTFAVLKKGKIKGKVKVGKKLKVVSAVLSPAATTVTYSWLRNGKAIKKATKRTYKLKKADAGKRISVKVGYVRAGWSTRTEKLAPVAKVGGRAT